MNRTESLLLQCKHAPVNHCYKLISQEEIVWINMRQVTQQHLNKETYQEPKEQEKSWNSCCKSLLLLWELEYPEGCWGCQCGATSSTEFRPVTFEYSNTNGQWERGPVQGALGGINHNSSVVTYPSYFLYTRTRTDSFSFQVTAAAVLCLLTTAVTLDLWELKFLILHKTPLKKLHLKNAFLLITESL